MAEAFPSLTKPAEYPKWTLTRFLIRCMVGAREKM